MWVKCIQLFVFLSFFVFIYGHNIECGEPNEESDNRIVGGRSLEYWKYPWFASLVMGSNPRQLVCGGSLITKKHVLTAAHCFKPFFESVKAKKKILEEIFVVKLGVLNICVLEETNEVFEVTKVFIQPDYYKDLLYYDIALLELDYPANNFMPICLPAAVYQSNNRSNMQASIIGLGKESSNAWRLPCVVKEAEVIVQPDEICRRFLNRANENGERFHDAFCAGNGEGKVDTCQGDSGGPLQVYTEDKYMLLGLTSFGFGCAKVNTYGIYTDVSHFLPWIKNCIGNEKYGTAGRLKQRALSAKEEIHENDESTKPPPRKRSKPRQRKYSNILEEILHE